MSKSVAGVATYYLYEGDSLVAGVDSSGNVVAGYTWGAQGLISRWAATPNGPASEFYQYDARGCAAAALDASGNVLGRAAYTAWGANYGTDGLAGPVGYAGRFGAHTAADTGLILMGSRYYAPALGRFISRDSAGFAGSRCAHRGGSLGG